MNNIKGKRNIAMMVDLYELTMANSYFLTENHDQVVVFDLFF